MSVRWWVAQDVPGEGHPLYPLRLPASASAGRGPAEMGREAARASPWQSTWGALPPCSRCSGSGGGELSTLMPVGTIAAATLASRRGDDRFCTPSRAPPVSRRAGLVWRAAAWRPSWTGCPLTSSPHPSLRVPNKEGASPP